MQRALIFSMVLGMAGNWACAQPGDSTVVVPRVAAREQLGGDRFAVIVGIDDYADPAVSDLRLAERDAQAVYDLLTNDSVGGVTARNATLLLGKDATTKRIKSALGKLREAPRESTVFVYFSGHGMQERGDGFWVTHDTDPNDLFASALSDTELKKSFGDLRAERVVVMIDACFAAATVHGVENATKGISDLLSKFTGKGHAILSAAGEGEEALESAELRHSVFTFYLLEGLRGRADTDQDGVVVLTELTDYLDKNVADEARRRKGIQKPVVDFQSVQEPAKFRLAIDPQRMEAVLELNKERRALQERRIARLRELALDDKLTLEQQFRGKTLLESDPSRLNSSDQLARVEFENVVDGKLAPEKLTAALSLIQARYEDNYEKMLDLAAHFVSPKGYLELANTRALRESRLMELSDGQDGFYGRKFWANGFLPAQENRESEFSPSAWKAYQGLRSKIQTSRRALRLAQFKDNPREITVLEGDFPDLGTFHEISKGFTALELSGSAGEARLRYRPKDGDWQAIAMPYPGWLAIGVESAVVDLLRQSRGSVRRPAWLNDMIAETFADPLFGHYAPEVSASPQYHQIGWCTAVRLSGDQVRVKVVEFCRNADAAEDRKESLRKTWRQHGPEAKFTHDPEKAVVQADVSLAVFAERLSKWKTVHGFPTTRQADGEAQKVRQTELSRRLARLRELAAAGKLTAAQQVRGKSLLETGSGQLSLFDRLALGEYTNVADGRLSPESLPIALSGIQKRIDDTYAFVLDSAARYVGFNGMVQVLRPQSIRGSKLYQESGGNAGQLDVGVASAFLLRLPGTADQYSADDWREFQRLQGRILAGNRRVMLVKDSNTLNLDVDLLEGDFHEIQSICALMSQYWTDVELVGTGRETRMR